MLEQITLTEKYKTWVDEVSELQPFHAGECLLMRLVCLCRSPNYLAAWKYAGCPL